MILLKECGAVVFSIRQAGRHPIRIPTEEQAIYTEALCGLP